MRFGSESAGFCPLRSASTFTNNSGLVVAVVVVLAVAEEAASPNASLLEVSLEGLKECNSSPAPKRS